MSKIQREILKALNAEGATPSELDTRTAAEQATRSAVARLEDALKAVKKARGDLAAATAYSAIHGTHVDLDVAWPVGQVARQIGELVELIELTGR